MKDLKKQFTKDEINGRFDGEKKMKVVFTKKDGSERTMICTKDISTIPEEFRPKAKLPGEKPSRPTPDHLCPVFDLEANGWRSFTIANVISIEPTGETIDEKINQNKN